VASVLLHLVGDSNLSDASFAVLVSGHHSKRKKKRISFNLSHETDCFSSFFLGGGGKFQTTDVACVASVSVGFQSKKSPKNGIFEVLAARKMGLALAPFLAWLKLRKSRSSDFLLF